MALNRNDMGNIYDSTSGPLYFMLVSVFESKEVATQVMDETYTQLFSSDLNVEPQDVFEKAAEICYTRLGRPNGLNMSQYGLDDMKAFFNTCEKFDTAIPDESVAAAQILERQVDSLEPVSRLTVYLRMYCEMPIETIAKVSGTDEESVSTQLFNNYRSIMAGSAEICRNSPMILGLPVLQLIHLSLKKRKDNAKFVDSSEKLFDSIVSKVIPPELKTEPFASEPPQNDNPSAFPTFDDNVVTTNKEEADPTVFVDFSPDAQDFSLFPEATQATDYGTENSVPPVTPQAVPESGFNPEPIKEEITPPIDDIYSGRDNTSDIGESFAGFAPAFDPIKEEPAPPEIEDVYSGRDEPSNPFDNTQDIPDFFIPQEDHTPVYPPVPPVPPVPPMPPTPPTPPTPPVPQNASKKVNTGVIIGIVAGVVVLAIIAVVAFLFNRGIISVPSFGGNEETTTSFDEEAETTAPETTQEETTVAPTEPPETVISTGTSAVTIDRSATNEFVFRPSQSGYYAFVSEENSLDLKAAIYTANDSFVTEDDDSASGSNFMAVTYCEAFQPITLKVSEVNSAEGTANVIITIYALDNSDGEALVSYQYYSSNGIYITNSDDLYATTNISSDIYRFNTSELKYPSTYEIDAVSRILWLGFDMTIDGSKVTVWYPTKF